MVSDEEDSDKDEMNEERERDALADELFDGEADDSEAPRERISNEFDSLDVDEEEDEDGKTQNCLNIPLIYINKYSKTLICLISMLIYFNEDYKIQNCFNFPSKYFKEDETQNCVYFPLNV